jgi:hypothetical protein
VLEFIKVDSVAVSDNIADEGDICHTEDTTAPGSVGVGVGVVHNTEALVEIERLVYEGLLDTQEATDLFHIVTIFGESENAEFRVVRDDVLRHRAVGMVKGGPGGM